MGNEVNIYLFILEMNKLRLKIDVAALLLAIFLFMVPACVSATVGSLVYSPAADDNLKVAAGVVVDKKTGEPYKFGLKDILHPEDSMNIAILYRSMLHSLFFFFYPTGKKNVSREEEIQLFEDECLIDRGVIRESQVSNRSERILIKQLFTLSQRYTGITETDQKAAVRAANNLVRACDLQEWYDNHKTEWTYVRRKN